jgi:hypothetical protein
MMVRTEEHSVRTTLVHVRFNGRSFDIPMRDLDIGTGSNDADVKTALAHYMDVPARELSGYVIDRHETGNWTIRPEAVFG